LLINTTDIVAAFESQVLETEPVASLFNQEENAKGYIKYGLYSRKTYFFHAYYKAFDLEAFKGDITNAKILAEILASLLKYFLTDLSQWTIITTPKRIHYQRFGYHFSSEVLKILAAQTGITFLPDIVAAVDKNKVNPEFYQLNPLPSNTKLMLYDDILTTGRTISTTLQLLRENPGNKLLTPNIPVIIGINNN